MENKNIIEVYNKLGFVCVSASLKINEEGKKTLLPLKGWLDMTETTIKKNKEMNALIIKNRTKLSDGAYLYIIDIDNKKNENGETGEEVFNKICQDNNIKLDTITQKTANKGHHYLFKTFNKKLYSNGQILGLKIDGVKHNIDVPNCIICEPSNYAGRFYKFINITDDINDIKILPEAIENIILKHIKDDKKEVITHDKQDIKNINTNYPLLNILIKHFDNYDTWAKMCWLLKSLNYSFDVFNDYSAKYPKKYNYNECLLFWEKCTATKNINEGLLYSLAKKENPEEFNKLKLSYNFFKPDETPVKTIEINKEYLIDIINNKNLDDTKDTLTNNLNEFFNNDNIKSFNIKSTYDTGKTNLLKLIMNKHKFNRILFISYRKTLTSDIYGSFKEYNFKDYRKCQCDKENKLIIQLESIDKLTPSECLFIGDEIDIPKYDLIIIDEIESVLMQFNSDTLKNTSKYKFELLEAIINNSNKLITLDGDLSFRGFNYIKYFGESINIINTYKKNLKEFKIIDDKTIFYNDITDSLTNGEKIVIVSQSATKCEEIEINLSQKFKNLKIKIYTGLTDDDEKTALKNVIKTWGELDVLIYSPTIEAGVNFDMLHFDKIYGVVSSGCNSQRAFLQMLSRVRKTFSNKILIYAGGLNYIKMEDKYIYTFDEVKQSLITFDIIKIEKTIINKKIVKKLSSYDINYCYNKIEELLKHPYYYLGYLEYLLIKKGHEVEFNLNDDSEKDDKYYKDKNKYELNKVDRGDRFDGINDISNKKYSYLLEKQKQDRATKTDKLQIQKYILKLGLGVDKLNGDILKYYDDTYIIKKVEHLISEENIKDNENQKTEEIKQKTEIIKDVINNLGFKLFQNITISREEFEERSEELMKTNKLFTKSKTSKILFNKAYKKIETNKQFLAFINACLESYKLKIISIQIRVKKADLEEVNKTRDTAYNLVFMDNYETINEIIQYKINKGYKLHDPDNIRPQPETETYKKLILNDAEKIEYNKELEENEKEDEEKEIMKEMKQNALKYKNTLDEY